MHVLQQLIARHKRGDACGVTSICSAHPTVVEASLRHAERSDSPFVLFEATCNQVNQDGGYTGMRPENFVEFVGDIAEEQSHHPDLHVSWGKCVVEIWTHKIQGLTKSDFYFAAKADRVY